MATIINIHNFVINDVFREAGKYSTFGNPRKPRNEARLSGRSIKKLPLLREGESIMLKVGRFRLLITENCLTKDRTEFKELTKKHILMLDEISRTFPEISEKTVHEMQLGFELLHNTKVHI